MGTGACKGAVYNVKGKCQIEYRGKRNGQKSAPCKMGLPPHIKGADVRMQFMNPRCFDFSESSSLKVVDAYHRKYTVLSELLDANPEPVVLAHEDWEMLLSFSHKRRRVKFTPEQLLRTPVIKYVEQGK